MEMSGLRFELARLTGDPTRQDTWLDDYGHWAHPVGEICSRLDAIELDSSQFLRFYADPPTYPSWRKVLQYHCQVANQSQSFYGSISREQWLRTHIESPDPVVIFDSEYPGLIIHSNVVPRAAFSKVPCLEPQHCRGFIPARAIVDGVGFPGSYSCKSCSLAEQLSRNQSGCMTAEELEPLPRFWVLGVKEVELVDDLGEGSEGKVSKIRWRKGVFARKRFNFPGTMERELEVALTASHPNIVHCFGYYGRPDSTDHDLFMELLDVDLYRFLFEARENGNDSPFSFRELLDVLLQVAQAMKHLHEKNFVHADLKPHNIFMSCFELAHSGVQYYLVKVGDFGCAQRVDSSSATVEDFDFRVGSLRYTAPEVLRCRNHRGASPPEHPQKIDVYSFGVVAYQVLTGVPELYEKRKPNDIKEGVIQGSLRPDLNFKGSLDGDRLSLLPLIQRCWTSNPEDRPSFSQICAELDGHVDKLQKKNAKRKHHSIGDSVIDCNHWSNKVFRAGLNLQ